MKIWIRRAKPADQGAIRRLVRGAGINPLGLDWPNFIVAVNGEQIVGTGQIRPHQDGSAELASIAVLPAYQGRGIGGVIVATLVSCHSGPLYLSCVNTMPAFYARFGFRIVEAAMLPPVLTRRHRVGHAITGALHRLGIQAPHLYAMRLAA
jgi:N-acetylglutamate synthase-like GNAT family acetyltransferase